MTSCSNTKKLTRKSIDHLTIVAINYKDLGVTTLRENRFFGQAQYTGYISVLKKKILINKIKTQLKYLKSLKPQKKDFWNFMHDPWLGLKFHINDNEEINLTFSREGYIKLGNKFYQYSNSLAEILHNQIPSEILQTLPENYPSCLNYKMTRKRIQELINHRKNVSNGVK